MIPSSARYQRVREVDNPSQHGEETVQHAIELVEATPEEDVSVINPLANQSSSSNRRKNEDSGPKFSVKVLLKESQFEVTNMTAETTIGEFKNAISQQCDIIPDRQRLIFAGKQLKPDDKTLSFFKVVSNSSVHLFPLPAQHIRVPTATPLTASSSNTSSTDRPTAATPTNSNNESTAYLFTSLGSVFASSENEEAVRRSAHTHTPAHFDPTISQSSREVRLWCVLLIFLSFMTLFNNFTYFTATGTYSSNCFLSIS
jgi:hypothetical protein